MAESRTEPTALGGRHYFLIRRLHSLTGLVPVGVFLCIHLTANATVLASAAEFQTSVDRIHLLGPFLVPVELVGIFLPLLFHAVLGLQISFTGRSNAQHYRYGGNVRYTLQRATGMVAMVFILYHVWQMHWLGKPFGGSKFDPHDAARTTAATLQAAWWIVPIYAIGVLACVFHLANGVWTSLITWGITVREESQRYAGYACAVFGVILSLLGLGSLYGFNNLDTQVKTPEVAAHTPASTSHAP